MQQKQILVTLLVLSLLSCQLLETEAKFFKFPFKFGRSASSAASRTTSGAARGAWRGKAGRFGKWLGKGVASNTLAAGVFFGVGAGINEAIEASKRKGETEKVERLEKNVSDLKASLKALMDSLNGI